MFDLFILLVKVTSLSMFFFMGYKAAEKTNKMYKEWFNE